MDPTPFRFEIVAECPHTRARAGLLHTAHGTIETPVFMPVGTQGTVKGLTQRMLKEDLGARIILGNTYHLYLRPGHETIERLGGLHRFINWDRAILTDSGGFQVFSLSALRKISDDGVVFRSHLDGSEHTLTPGSAVEIQQALGSDILMVLDECTEYPASHEHARASMYRTIEWARRGMRRWRDSIANGAEHPQATLGNPGGAPANPEANLPRARAASALFPIVQGSMFADLRQACARELIELDAPGYAVGGLSVGEPRPLSGTRLTISPPCRRRSRRRSSSSCCTGSASSDSAFRRCA
jgi:queuine tRNA-ribosyltransferase